MSYTSAMDGSRRRLVLLAALVLAAGASVYAFDRPPGSIAWLPLSASPAAGAYACCSRLGGSLPAFAHIYAFILLTAAALPRRGMSRGVCAAWWLVESLFEIGQHAAVAPRIAAALPAWLAQLPVFGNTSNYLQHGTFDPVDLAAIACGALAAYLTLGIVPAKEVGHGRTIQFYRRPGAHFTGRHDRPAWPGDPDRQRRRRW